MSKRDEFITIIRTLKSTLPNISEDQYKDLIGRGMRDHGLSRDEAEKILKDEGLIVGELVNYFEVLELTIDELKNISNDEVEALVLPTVF